MVRVYKRKLGARNYINYSASILADAVQCVKDGMPLREAASAFNIHKSTLANKAKEKHQEPVGKPTVFTKEEETWIVEAVLLLAEWGFPVETRDLKELAASFLEKIGRNVANFVNNRPGGDWVPHFMKPHEKQLSHHFANNIKRSRALKSKEEMKKYFDNLANTIKDVPPNLVPLKIRYDSHRVNQ